MRVAVGRCPLVVVVPVRWAVLRPDESDSSRSVYPGDLSGVAAHWCALVDGVTVGVVSVVYDPFPAQLGVVWRVRGFGVLPGWRNQGVGRLLLHTAVGWCGSRGCEIVWVSVRVSQQTVYARWGPTVHGEPYQVDGTGLHVDIRFPTR